MNLKTLAQLGAAATLCMVTAVASNAQARIPITLPTGNGSFPAPINGSGVGFITTPQMSGFQGFGTQFPTGNVAFPSPFNSNGGGLGFVLTPQMQGFQGFGPSFGGINPNLGNATGFTNYTGYNTGGFQMPLSASQGGAIIGGGGGYYGGGAYGQNDPSLVVSPYGVYPAGNGNDGPSSQDAMRAAYQQGYIEAQREAMAQQMIGPGTTAPSTAVGMTATPYNLRNRVPHGSDGVRAWRVGNQVALRWQGDPRIASSVTFSITDRNGRAIRGATVNELPAEARFTPTDNAAYYEAVVHYVDGQTNTIMGKLPGR
ncbi:MAG TPA: hypothetical protein VKT77_08120 [Chthonomonadaceae bacterium]|nr:hypothetical protein [Chthonomonadaceae bacterium]